jgi:diguanylate cyclase (GGDEF)-like protein
LASEAHASATVASPTAAGILQRALIDSRQRWRELIHLAADFAFETDEFGNFTLITPDSVLGWGADALIGQASNVLLAEAGGALFDPFRVSATVRHRQAWLKRGDGGIACLMFCAAPIRDIDGRITGARGIGVDMTEFDGQAAQVAVALRRAEVLDHILWRMGREVTAPRMMGAVLDALADAMGIEGAAVILAPTDSLAVALAHVTGNGADAVLDAAGRQLRNAGALPEHTTTAEGRPVLIAACQTRFGQKAGLVAWRQPAAREWDDDDRQLLGSAVNIIRMVLEHEATQREMVRQARTDPLTGLLNRRAFLEEVERHAARQDRDNVPGTLMFADVDNFKPVNDRMGHEAGDEVLRATAALLRKTFRPTDLVARLGGDEFAIWLNGADHMTAAERAEFLRDAVPREMAEIVGPDGPRLTLSIGIASREPGDGEPLGDLMRRADHAMYEVKRGGRGHWRVSLRKLP